MKVNVTLEVEIEELDEDEETPAEQEGVKDALEDELLMVGTEFDLGDSDVTATITSVVVSFPS